MALLTLNHSGVLKAALERSRQKWMTPGIFELYYSKAGKKKLPNKGKNKEQNKDKDEKDKEGGGGPVGGGESESLKAKQMKREGNCKLYIDPHQWDVTVWTMRENTVPPPPKPKPAPAPAYNGQGYYYGGGYSATHPYQHYHPYPPQNPAHQPPQPVKKPPPAPPAQPAPPPPPPSQPHAPEPIPAPSKPAPDPVIHMLAERANTNFKLRDIMKIVARGDASKEQLEYFQSHINELTERLEAQKKAQQAQQPPTPSPAQATPPVQPAPAQPAAASPAPPAASAGASRAAPSLSPATPTPSKMPQQPPMTYYTPPPPPGPYGHYQPAPPPPPQPVQQPHPPQAQPQHHQHQHTYRALCIDFNTNGDRLLFPRETILEALPGNQVLASFLKVQKVDLVTSANLPKTQTYYKPLKEYYQPITVRFRADNPNTLQCLWRWVKPQEEVRKWMEEVMDRAECAEEVELAARLPREGVVFEGQAQVQAAAQAVVVVAAAQKQQQQGAIREEVAEIGAEGREKKRAKRSR